MMVSLCTFCLGKKSRAFLVLLICGFLQSQVYVNNATITLATSDVLVIAPKKLTTAYVEDKASVFGFRENTTAEVCFVEAEEDIIKKNKKKIARRRHTNIEEKEQINSQKVRQPDIRYYLTESPEENFGLGFSRLRAAVSATSLPYSKKTIEAVFPDYSWLSAFFYRAQKQNRYCYKHKSDPECSESYKTRPPPLC